MRETTHYKLPLFDSSDQPKWLVDWNGAMAKLDNILHTIEAGSPDIPTIRDLYGMIQSINAQIASIKTNIAATFDENTNYYPNDFVVYNDALYICVDFYTAGDGWNDAYFTPIRLADKLTYCLNRVSYLQSQIYNLNDKIPTKRTLWDGLDTDMAFGRLHRPYSSSDHSVVEIFRLDGQFDTSFDFRYAESASRNGHISLDINSASIPCDGTVIPVKSPQTPMPDGNIKFVDHIPDDYDFDTWSSDGYILFIALNSSESSFIGNDGVPLETYDMEMTIPYPTVGVSYPLIPSGLPLFEKYTLAESKMKGIYLNAEGSVAGSGQLATFYDTEYYGQKIVAARYISAPQLQNLGIYWYGDYYTHYIQMLTDSIKLYQPKEGNKTNSQKANVSLCYYLQPLSDVPLS